MNATCKECGSAFAGVSLIQPNGSDVCPSCMAQKHMEDALEKSISAVLSKYVGQMQSAQEDDDVRKSVRLAIGRFMRDWPVISPLNIGPTGDLAIRADNSPEKIAAGYMSVQIIPQTELGRAFLRKMKEITI